MIRDTLLNLNMRFPHMNEVRDLQGDSCIELSEGFSQDEVPNIEDKKHADTSSMRLSEATPV